MKLKRRRSDSDTSVMFFSAASAPDPASTELRELRLSMNTPVLAVDGLPVGPARAAITLVQGPAGGPRLEVAIHSLRTDEVLFYAYGAASAAARDLDAALSFAGAMGFLFDEDEITGNGEAGLQLWTDWVGKAAQPPRSEPQATGDREGKAAQPPRSEAEPSEDRRDEPRSEPRSQEQPSEAGTEPILLTKFRWGAQLAEPGGWQGPLPGRV
jgi:hypothetical protein